MRCLVTGGAGFIGSNLVEALVERGDEVVVLDSLITGARENLDFAWGKEGFAFVAGDVRDAETLRRAVVGVEVVFHLAAEVGNLNSLEHPLRDAQVNIVGTVNVLEAALEARIKALVYASSSAIFGEPQYLPIDEAHPTSPESFYGVSKLAGEKYSLAFAKLYSLRVTCLRYFNVYGPRQKYNPYANVIPIFAERLLGRQPPIIYGDGAQTRDFVQVRDVVRANLLAAESGLTGQAFNIGSGVQTSIVELAAMMQEITGVELKPIHDPPRSGEVRHSVADIGRARTLLGYEPQVALGQGLREFIAWWRKESSAG